MDLRPWIVAAASALAIDCAMHQAAAPQADALSVELVTLPASYRGRDLLVEGTLLFMDGRAWFIATDTTDAVRVVFPDNFGAASDRQAVKLLTRLRKESLSRFETPGISSLTVHSRYAWASLHGRVEPRSGPEEPSNWIGLRASHQFVVDRVLEARQVTAPKRH